MKNTPNHGFGVFPMYRDITIDGEGDVFVSAEITMRISKKKSR